MDVYQRAWASLLKRIEAKTSWGRNELKQQMLEALVEAGGCPLCEQDNLSAHINHVDREQAMSDRGWRAPKEVDHEGALMDEERAYHV